MTMAIGAPSYGSKKKNNWRLKDGSNVYRILPPIGKLAADGVWAVFDALHWGYRGSKGMRPFKCIQKKDFKTKMIKVQCPECDKIAEKKALFDATVEAKKAEGMTKEQAEEFAKPLGDWLFSHNLDKKWYVNALMQDGQIGRLAIPHKMYQQLQILLERLVTKENVDPIAVDGGVWFDFVRTGKGRETAFSVTVVEEMQLINGRQMKSYKPAQLTNEILTRLSTEAYDLADAVRLLSYDEIKRVVSSNGDTDVIDAVFSSPEPREVNAPDADEPDPGSFGGTNVLSAAAPTTPSPAATAPVVAAPQLDQAAQIAALMAQLAALQPVATTGKVVSVAPAPAAPVSAPLAAAELNDDDFIAQYGIKK